MTAGAEGRGAAPAGMTALEERMLRALRAAEEAFEAGYPAKARSIVQGALRLVDERERLRRVPPAGADA